MSENWFTTLTGLPNDSPDTVQAGINVAGDMLTSRANGRHMRAGTLTTPRLADLRAATQGHLGRGRSTFREIVADVQDLHQDPANAGALFQVASQFNLLEMVRPDVRPQDGIARYENDHTQGPACAIACGAGTIYRNYFAPVHGQIGQTQNHQIDCLADLGTALGNANGALWDMRNGYALPRTSGLAALNKAIAVQDRDTLRGLLRIGVQSNTEVTLGANNHTVTQVFCSALPIAYSEHMPWHLESLSQLILEAAYEATLHTAVLNYQRTGHPTVYLTLLGGGAFGNDPQIIIAALTRALHLFAGAGLAIVMVSYGQSAQILAPLIARS